MKTKHIVLRGTRWGSRNTFRGVAAAGFEGLGGVGEPEPLSCRVEEIEHRDLPALNQEAGVVAVAPAMPMRLVAPRAAAGGEAASPNGTAWGVTAVGADRSPFDGDGVVVAVLDTGIDANHAAFRGVTLVRENFTDEGPDDLHGHGTHCAGTIFGRAVDGVRIGVAPGVKRALIGKVLGAGGGGSDRIASAILWAVDHGAEVISMSLGIDFPGWVAELVARGFPPELATNRALEDYRANLHLFESLAVHLQSRAVFGGPAMLVAAAGNESRREVNPQFEVGVSPPAVAQGFLSVAALGRASSGLDVAEFSNTGANIAGPGVDIVSARAGGGLVSMSGTSMATPHVAGVAALWAQRIRRIRQLAASEWNARVIGSATLQGLASGIDLSDIGAGLVQAPAA